MTRTSPLGETADFSPIAFRYDETRRIPERALLSCYDRLVERGLFPKDGLILDAGCGTGQISLPLAAQGYRIVGIDISTEMAKIAQSKVRPDWQAQFSAGDVRNIEERDGRFDAVVVSKLFQHIQDWPEACRQLIRVTRPGRPIAQINERGAFGNAVRRQFSRRADELGFANRYIGLDPHSNAELTNVMMSEGCQPTSVDMRDRRWDIQISYDDALSQIREGLFAEFWHLPAQTFARLLAEVAEWVDAQPDGGRTIECLSPYLVVDVFRTPF